MAERTRTRTSRSGRVPAPLSPPCSSLESWPGATEISPRKLPRWPTRSPAPPWTSTRAQEPSTYSSPASDQPRPPRPATRSVSPCPPPEAPLHLKPRPQPRTPGRLWKSIVFPPTRAARQGLRPTSRAADPESPWVCVAHHCVSGPGQREQGPSARVPVPTGMLWFQPQHCWA